MIPFFSPKINGKEQIAGRAVITAAALLFLVTALLSSLPSKDRITDLLESAGLSGYSHVEETVPSRPKELEEFYDRPLTQGKAESSELPDSGNTGFPIRADLQFPSDLYYSSGGVNAKIA